MSSSSSRNNNGASGSGGARFAQCDLQLQLAPPGERVEVVDGGNDNDKNSSSPSLGVSSDGSQGSNKERMIICICSQCALFCMVPEKVFPACMKCKQPTLIDLLEAAAAGERKRALDAAAAAKDKSHGKHE